MLVIQLAIILPAILLAAYIARVVTTRLRLRRDVAENALSAKRMHRLGMAATVGLNHKLMASHLAHTKDSTRSRFTAAQKDAL